MARSNSALPGVSGASAATGTLPGEFPYVRVGDGPRTLAVLPGFGDAMFTGRYPAVAAPILATYFRRYLDDHTVYLLSRPRGLPAGYTARESADDHARLFEDVLGPVDALGISMGGLVAQELAANRGDLVDRLVLASTACRLGDEGREPVRRMLAYAHEHDWAAIRSELSAGMFADWRRFAYPPLVQTVGRFVMPRPADPDDVVVSLELILEYDGCDHLAAVDAPTLVIGGARDPYFTEPAIHATAAGIADARLSIVSGGKHGVFHERKAIFDRRTTDFLARP